MLLELLSKAGYDEQLLAIEVWKEIAAKKC
jgi:hypothetical protein